MGVWGVRTSFGFGELGGSFRSGYFIFLGFATVCRGWLVALSHINGLLLL